ncbi:MAG TPA: hypothetical protein VKJ65_13055 [Phycisphaerae bacterium]|nr:hypothetical protein [Phycisphaerae bacterium]
METTTGKITRVIKGHGLLAAVIAGLTASSGAVMADTGNTATTSSAASTAQLEAQIEALQTKVTQLQTQENQQSNDATREAQIAQVVKQVLSDAQFRSQYLDNSLQAGYNKGFFIQTADGDFKLNVNGQLQFRYQYAQANNNETDAFTAGKSLAGNKAPYPVYWDPGIPTTGDVDGFSWRRARLIFSGNVFSPDLTFKVMGDFGGEGSSDNGEFQMQDVYMAYKLSPLIQFRAGSFLIPFTHVEYISSGLEFPDFNPVVDAYDPVRALGFSMYGDIIPHQMDYEVNINNGAKTNDGGNPAAFGTSNGDNRVAFAGRWEMFDSADAPDFTSEPDINWTKNLEWMLGFAFLYDSQNPKALSSNGSKSIVADGTTNVIQGLSSVTTPGFISNYTLSGDDFRFEGDYTLHYQGLSISPVVFYQQIEDNGQSTMPETNGTVLTGTHTITQYYGISSFGQLGYYIQGGYFLVPHRWEVATSWGQLYNVGTHGHNAATYIQAGINYYLFGNNAKIQVAETYTPMAAFTDSNYGTSQNTRDFITQVQFQLTF